MGLQHIDTNMSKHQGKWDDKGGDQPENAGHAQVYVDMETATAYSQSSLNEMPPGVYLVDAKMEIPCRKRRQGICSFYCFLPHPHPAGQPVSKPGLHA